jgi:antitoxin component YwqK of YwqJK toxin-antitoxin module
MHRLLLLLAILVVPCSAFAQKQVKRYFDTIGVSIIKEIYYVIPGPDSLKTGTYTRFHTNKEVAVMGQYDEKGQQTGTWQEFYRSGKKKLTCPYKEGKKNGTLLSFAEHGQLLSKGLFVDNKLTDTLFAYYPNGALKSKALFVNDWPEGLVTDYFMNGNKKTEINYQNSKPNGISKEWYENSKQKLEAFYKNGALEGNFKTWFINGNLETESVYLAGEKTGSFKNYAEAGYLQTEGNYLKGKVHGETKSYHANGKIKSKVEYKEGKPSGLSYLYNTEGLLSAKREFSNNALDLEVTEYHPNGKKRRVYSTKNSEKTKTGTWKWWYDNGNLSKKEQYDEQGRITGTKSEADSLGNVVYEENYAFGNLNAERTTYYSNGKKNEVNFYKGGRKSGLYKKYSEAGTLVIEGQHKNGYKVGKWLYYNSEKQATKEETYSNGGKLTRTKNLLKAK